MHKKISKENQKHRSDYKSNIIYNRNQKFINHLTRAIAISTQMIRRNVRTSNAARVILLKSTYSQTLDTLNSPHCHVQLQQRKLDQTKTTKETNLWDIR